MKKVKLKALEAGAKELLSREQLKNVFGGSTSGICNAVGCNYSIGGSDIGSGLCMGISFGNSGGSTCACAGIIVAVE